MHRLTIALIGLFISTPVAADDEAIRDKTETMDRVQAADAAAELKAQAYSVDLDTDSEAGEKMQAYVDQIGVVVTLLESELRAGKQRGETEILYRELRRLRLEAIGLAISGGADLPEGAVEFEALLAELGRYQRGAQSQLSVSPE